MDNKHKTDNGSMALVYTLRAIGWALLGLLVTLPLVAFFYWAITSEGVEIPTLLLPIIFIGIFTVIGLSATLGLKVWGNIEEANKALGR